MVRPAAKAKTLTSAVGSECGPHAPPLRGSLPPEGAGPALGRPGGWPFGSHAPPLRGSRVAVSSLVERRPLISNKVLVRHLQRGFTLLELMVVIAVIALATATVSLALPDSNRDRLETEALRLSALLESARAQSRTSGVPVYWRTTENGFEFLGLSSYKDAPNPLAGTRTWLQADTRAQVVTPTATANLVLGPEPLITAQRLQLRLGAQTLTLATDGLGPFTVTPGTGTPP